MPINKTADFQEIISHLLSNSQQQKHQDIKPKKPLSNANAKTFQLYHEICKVKRKISNFKNYHQNIFDFNSEIKFVKSELDSLKRGIVEAEKELPATSVATYSAHDQQSQHHQAIFSFLNEHLATVADQLNAFQKEYNERRVQIQIGSMKAFEPSFTTAKNAPSNQVNNGWEMNDSDDILENADNYNDDDLADLDPTLLKELLEENESLLLQFQATQDDIAQVTQSIHHIATLQSTLNTHLSAQNEVIEAICNDAEEVATNIDQGVSILHKTEEVMGRGGKWWVLAVFVGFAAVLLGLDAML